MKLVHCPQGISAPGILGSERGGLGKRLFLFAVKNDSVVLLDAVVGFVRND